MSRTGLRRRRRGRRNSRLRRRRRSGRAGSRDRRRRRAKLGATGSSLSGLASPTTATRRRRSRVDPSSPTFHRAEPSAILRRRVVAPSLHLPLTTGATRTTLQSQLTRSSSLDRSARSRHLEADGLLPPSATRRRGDAAATRSAPQPALRALLRTARPDRAFAVPARVRRKRNGRARMVAGSRVPRPLARLHLRRRPHEVGIETAPPSGRKRAPTARAVVLEAPRLGQLVQSTRSSDRTMSKPIGLFAVGAQRRRVRGPSRAKRAPLPRQRDERGRRESVNRSSTALCRLAPLHRQPASTHSTKKRIELCLKVGATSTLGFPVVTTANVWPCAEERGRSGRSRRERDSPDPTPLRRTPSWRSVSRNRRREDSSDDDTLVRGNLDDALDIPAGGESTLLQARRRSSVSAREVRTKSRRDDSFDPEVVQQPPPEPVKQTATAVLGSWFKTVGSLLKGDAEHPEADAEGPDEAGEQERRRRREERAQRRAARAARRAAREAERADHEDRASARLEPETSERDRRQPVRRATHGAERGDPDERASVRAVPADPERSRRQAARRAIREAEAGDHSDRVSVLRESTDPERIRRHPPRRATRQTEPGDQASVPPGPSESERSRRRAGRRATREAGDDNQAGRDVRSDRSKQAPVRPASADPNSERGRREPAPPSRRFDQPARDVRDERAGRRSREAAEHPVDGVGIGDAALADSAAAPTPVSVRPRSAAAVDSGLHRVRDRVAQNVISPREQSGPEYDRPEGSSGRARRSERTRASRGNADDREQESTRPRDKGDGATGFLPSGVESDGEERESVPTRLGRQHELPVTGSVPLSASRVSDSRVMAVPASTSVRSDHRDVAGLQDSRAEAGEQASESGGGGDFEVFAARSLRPPLDTDPSDHAFDSDESVPPIRSMRRDSARVPPDLSPPIRPEPIRPIPPTDPRRDHRPPAARPDPAGLAAKKYRDAPPPWSDDEDANNSFSDVATSRRDHSTTPPRTSERPLPRTGSFSRSTPAFYPSSGAESALESDSDLSDSSRFGGAATSDADSQVYAR